MGEIYIIRNTVNDKVYIGQTTHNAEHRFRIHLNCANNTKYNSKLYTNMRKIGFDNFYVETLIKCENVNLTKLEIEYINKYNSINNGYNSILPGNVDYTGFKNNGIDDKIIEYYLSGVTTPDICIALNISIGTVFRVIKEYGKHREPVKTGRNETIGCTMYSLDFIPQRSFNSKADALRYLLEVEHSKTSTEAFYSQTKIAFENGNIVCGHRWQATSGLLYNNKLFRSKFDIKAYLNGGALKLDNTYNIYYVDGALDFLKQVTKENHCIDCGKKISSRNSRCFDCHNKAQIIHNNHSDIKNGKICNRCNRKVAYTNLSGLCSSCSNVEAKGKSPKPSKSELKQLLDMNIQIVDIAKMYGRVPSTVHYWINSYGLR